jgi:DNA polymerase-3 subunit epsilon
MTRPVGSQRFTVVDVETSGLDVRRHRVLQVGVVTVDGDGAVLARWSTLVAPRRRLFFRVGPTSLHGIRRRHLRHAPPLESVMHQLAARLHGTRFVAHNAPFDLAFLRKSAAEVGVALPVDHPLCTLRLSRSLDPGRTLSHRLADLCVRYGVSLDRPHDALADAEATAAILPHLLKAHGVVTVDQLSALPAAS